jgi:hypothetical protein
MAALVSFSARRSAAVHSLGSIEVAPMTVRIWRINLRTASRKAQLAFSIKYDGRRARRRDCRGARLR